jgi:replicative DNA helicase
MSTPPGIRAEQALLGTFLSGPGPHLPLLSVVSPADMFRPYHGQVLAAIQRLDSQGALAMLHRGNGSEDNQVPAAVLAELGRDPDVPAHIARDGNQLHTLMAAAPVPPNPESYAAIVVDGSLRREITTLGKRVAQAARHYELSMLESALELARQAAQDLETARARWEALPAAMRQSLRVPPSRAGGPAEIGRRFQDISIALAVSVTTSGQATWSC